MNNRRTRLLILAPILMAATWLALFGDKTPNNSSGVVEAVTHAAPPAPAPAAEATEAVADEAVPGQIRRVSKRSAPAADAPGDLFAAAAAVETAAPENQPPPPPPPPPPQPFVLIGRMLDQDRWAAFLERDGRIHVVRAHDVVDGFRCDSMTAQEIRLTQLSDKTRVVIPIEGEKKDPAHD